MHRTYHIVIIIAVAQVGALGLGYALATSSNSTPGAVSLSILSVLYAVGVIWYTWYYAKDRHEKELRLIGKGPLHYFVDMNDKADRIGLIERTVSVDVGKSRPKKKVDKLVIEPTKEAKAIAKRDYDEAAGVLGLDASSE
jgi:hypothetical protein